MGLFALVMMNRRIDQRQDQIEEKEHNRRLAREFQAAQAAGKSLPETAGEPPTTAVGDSHWQRKISVRPLIVFFAGVVVFSALGLIWQQTRAKQHGARNAEEPPA